MVAALAIYRLAIAPLAQSFSDADAAIAEKYRLLARVQSASRIEAPRAGSVLGAAAYFPGADEGAATAALQESLKSIADGAKARFVSVGALPDQARGSAMFVGARIEVRGSLESIVKMAHAIENGRRLAFVDGAIIRSDPAPPAPGADARPTLTTQFDVYGATIIAAKK
ncbi:MAG: hypothetical protein KGI57_07700 [Hyphomicrobiales bacterium]|nr:hypothetical protein [Hyphomicrobiales bacterium]